MNPTTPDFSSLSSAASSASSAANDMDASAPGLLSQLKQNLVGIFTKDNPVLQARDSALSNYLATPNNVRSEILTPNLPEVIPGRQLTLSPTQQAAIVSARQAAAFAPLAGLNEIVKGMFGNIGDIVQGAGSIYSAQSAAAHNRASDALNLYKAAIDQYQATKPAAGSGGSGFDLAALLKALQGGNPGQGNGAPGIDDIFANNVPGAQPAPTISNPSNDLQLTAQPALPGTPDWLTQIINGRTSVPTLSNVNLNPYMTPSSGINLSGGASPFAGMNLGGLHL